MPSSKAANNPTGPAPMMATSVLIWSGMGAFLLQGSWTRYRWAVAPILLPLPNLEATEALGSRIAAGLWRGDAVLLEGPLGAGKSALARALLRCLLGDP